MSERRFRVLVVDDSAFARKVVREVLSASPRLEVVDIARDGLEALEKIATLRPDVITLDLVMPQLDGVGVLRALPAEGAPRVVVVSMSDAESALGLEALHAGALDVVQKPTALATERLYELGHELREKVLAAAEARTLPAAPSAAPPVRAPSVALRGTELVVVGTSTGGPQALTRLLTALPVDFPVPVAVALHIPAGYTAGLSARLNTQCALEVIEAVDGAELRPGRVVIAPGGRHLRLAAAAGDGKQPLRLRVTREGDGGLHVPSVNALFESAAERLPGKVLAVVMTGMGDDGLIGARRIRGTGGTVLTEAEVSCVVYGMPRAVHEAGLSTAQAPLEALPALIARYL